MSLNRSLGGTQLRVVSGVLFSFSVLGLGIHFTTSESELGDAKDGGDEHAHYVGTKEIGRVHKLESDGNAKSGPTVDDNEEFKTPSRMSPHVHAKKQGSSAARAELAGSARDEIKGRASDQAKKPGRNPPNSQSGLRSRPASVKASSRIRKNKAGLYAMKGPMGGEHMVDGNRGAMGQMTTQSGSFIAPSALRRTSGGRGYGRGAGATMREGLLPPVESGFEFGSTIGINIGAESGPNTDPNRWKQRMVPTAEDAKSTFSIDVDTASYSYVRSVLERGRLPTEEAVRVEEMINYFDYGYDLPPEGSPIWADGEVGPCPWNSGHKLVHIGVQADVVSSDERLARNLVFLIDVSGSMSAANRLPLLKQALAMLVSTLDESDRISIVVYAGAAGEVLPPTSGANEAEILAALQRLQSGGSTNGSQGIELAYKLAQSTFIDDGVNRVILATDGDFNVGTTSHDALIDLISRKRKTGVYLSVLRFGHGSHSDRTMEQIADRGNGNYAYIDSIQEAHKVLVEQAGATLVPVADDVKIQVEFDPKAVRSYRLLGYENRRLAHRDFADDRKDAGEIGMGHTVTAIYEIDLQPEFRKQPGETLMSLRLRYKNPGGSESKLLERSIKDRDVPLHATSDAFRFSAAVAEYGELLAGQRFPEGGFPQVLRLAENARGTDAWCYRAGFIELVSKAAALAGHPELAARGDLSCSNTEAPPRVRATLGSIELSGDRDLPADSDGMVSVLNHICRLPMSAPACELDSVTSFVRRRVPLWMCILPAMLGGLLLELSQRTSRRKSTENHPRV